MNELIEDAPGKDYMSEKSRLLAAYHWSIFIDCMLLMTDDDDKTYFEYADKFAKIAFDLKDGAPSDKLMIN